MDQHSFSTTLCFLLVLCLGCVPLHQQLSESEASEIEGYVGPLIIDEDQFYFAASFHGITDAVDPFLPYADDATYRSTFDGKKVYIRNCKCLTNVQIIQDKLVMKHRYGGGASNRQSTVLLWNGKYYQDKKGDYIVDLIMYSDIVDLRRALIYDKKILDIKDVQREDKKFVWINLLGYERLIKYAY